MTSTAANQWAEFLTYSHVIGIANMEGRGFYFPSDTAIGIDGRFYTVNRSVEGDTRGVRVTVYDIDGGFFGTFGSFGEGPGSFISPTSIAVDCDGLVYIGDEYTNLVSIFEPGGTFLRSWGSQGTGPGELDGPAGMAFDGDGDVYISDDRNHRIQKFTRDGAFLLSFGTEGSGEGHLDLPWGVAVGTDGVVYVADWGNNRIQKFSADGEFLGQIGTSGTSDGQLNRPAGVAVDADGYIYVADWGNERVQVFNPGGEFATKLRGSATTSKWAQDFLNTNVEEAEARKISDMEPDLAQFGGDPHEESAHVEKLFWAPVSVKLDDDSRLYVTESNRHRVQIYEPAS